MISNYADKRIETSQLRPSMRTSSEEGIVYIAGKTKFNSCVHLLIASGFKI